MLGEVMDRQENLRGFIERAGWGNAEISPLAGDASNRRYDRLRQPDGMSAVLMDAPPSKGEDIRTFVNIATYLTNIGLSAPRIIAQDPKQGFLVLEDLGDALFARVIAADPTLENTLYEAAIDTLVHLHRAPPPALQRLSADVSAPSAALVYDWYRFGATGEDDAGARDAFTSLFQETLTPLDVQPQVLIQRDYHAENLLWLPEREGPARVGLLDFQDAMLGHTAYDLVSVLQDARRDVPAPIEQAMIKRFLDQSPQDPDQFTAAYATLGLQRNLRILGVFARLCIRDGKVHYVDLIPRVWGHIQTNLQHPALKGIADHIDQSLPPPTPEVLDILRSKCATLPDR